jgi:hypothetical protein
MKTPQNWTETTELSSWIVYFDSKLSHFYCTIVDLFDSICRQQSISQVYLEIYMRHINHLLFWIYCFYLFHSKIIWSYPSHLLLIWISAAIILLAICSIYWWIHAQNNYSTFNNKFDTKKLINYHLTIFLSWIYSINIKCKIY